ncbi:hypothetical protein [Hymenobacter sp. B1770]|uniref:hypothetical protein n=1 Tax=Hymenobacter sp. B1770 TaxID=1718788 RepID=UPI003CEE76B7
MFYSSQALAQAYEPGLLVRSNGDTLSGEIENGFWEEPPPFIRFRASAQGASQLFQPRQLQAVVFNKGRYFRYEILPIDHAANTRLDRLPTSNIVNIHTDSVLAEVLLEGPVSLFRVATRGSVHYLLRGPGQPVLDLCERKYLRLNARGANEIADGNNYHSQLALYFSECAAASTAALAAPFTPEALVGVVQAYNQNCSSTREAGRSRLVEAALSQPTTSIQGGVLAGVRYNNIQSPARALNTDCTDCRVRPFGGFYGEMLLPGRTSAVYGELSLSSFRNTGVAYDITSGYGGNSPLSYFDYQGMLSTARLGARFFLPLPRDQQLLLGLGLELNSIWRLRYATTSGPKIAPYVEDLVFAEPTWLPNLAVGWRSSRFTLSLDGQLYRSRDKEGNISSTFFGTSSVVRVSTAYRLSRNRDELPQKK